MRRASIAILLVATFAVATSCGDGDEYAHGELTASQIAGLESWEDEMEASGYLRPLLPKYLPPGTSLDPVELADAQEAHIVTIFFRDFESPELTIVRNLEEDSGLSCVPDERFECLSAMGDDDASLQVIRQTGGNTPRWTQLSKSI